MNDNSIIYLLKRSKQLLDDYYKEIHNSNIHSYLMSNGIFENDFLPKALLNISDESYRYYIDYIITHNTIGVLLNVFSGSGRLIKELKAFDLLSSFSIINNIDISKNMISFEKKSFCDKNLNFYCNDILNFENNTITFDIAICHCGIRYITKEKLSKLIHVLLSQKRSNSSRCLVTESNLTAVKLFYKDLNSITSSYTIEKHIAPVHRNTRLYASIMLYKNSEEFKSIIDSLSSLYFSNSYSVLADISGYKTVEFFTFIF